MGLKELHIGTSYETLGDVDPVSDFYIPALSQAVEYDRSVGFFSSASLALAARGVAGLIRNGGTMRLIVSPNLNERDIDAIKLAANNPDEVIEGIASELLGNIDALADEIERDHVKALGWMLANGRLEMKIAVIVDEDGNVQAGQLYHQKIGLIEDCDGDALSFSGSVNETASGWLLNCEEFKVFKSWEPGQLDFYQSDRAKFESLWNGEHKSVKTFVPTHSFCEKLVSAGANFELEHSVIANYRRTRKQTRISLFPYQKEALEAWLANDGRLLFEMATGTGKTRTALACVGELLAREKKFVCIVATPQSTLSRQWEKETAALGLQFDKSVFADSSAGPSARWLKEISSAISRIRIGRSSSLIIYTTHKSACSKKLLDIINKLPDSVATCIVGDEVHGMGSPKQRAGLLERYRYRIGLSATPSRWFDEDGTELIRRYFGDRSFVFTIAQAQNTINPITGDTFLCPYEYHLVFSSLNDEELDKYCALTKRIVAAKNSPLPDAEEHVEKLLRDRAEIKKDAASKMVHFEDLIDSVDLTGAIVFTSPHRISEVCLMLGSHEIAAHRFTEEEGTAKRVEYGGLSEREYLLDAFRQGDIQTLVAIKCLDEGIDIPEAKTAVLLSSSTNPREYVQRVGRVIRRHPGKKIAHIYDFVIEPDWKRIKEMGGIELEKKLFKQEMVRIEDMRANAVNSTDLLFEVQDRLRRANGY